MGHVSSRPELRCDDRGYAMAALLVGLAVIVVMASVAMPVWRTVVQREKEEELVFRGQQYVRSIRLFQRKYANAYPPNIELLIDQRFLRKKYKDPITDGDFVLLYQGMMAPSLGGRGGATVSGRGVGPDSTGAGTQPSPAGTTQPPGATTQPPGGLQSQGGAPATSFANQQAAGPRGGIVGVVSKSTGKSFRIYNGRSAYNEWQFVFVPSTLPGRGASTPGGRGGGRGRTGTTQQPRRPGMDSGGTAMQPPPGRGF